jgi:hypothetical protein
MGHARNLEAPQAAIVTSDTLPLARGQWRLAERAGLVDELRDLRYVALVHTAAGIAEQAKRAELVDRRVESADRDDDEWRRLDDEFEAAIESTWAAGSLLCALPVGRTFEAALRIERAAHVFLAPLHETRLPPAVGRDVTRHLAVARLAVVLVASEKKSKELQLEAAGDDRPLAVCQGEHHPAGFVGCGRVFEDRAFPDSAGRGPNGRMFRYWCPEHAASGASRRLRQRGYRRLTAAQRRLLALHDLLKLVERECQE